MQLVKLLLTSLSLVRMASCSVCVADLGAVAWCWGGTRRNRLGSGVATSKDINIQQCSHNCSKETIISLKSPHLPSAIMIFSSVAIVLASQLVAKASASPAAGVSKRSPLGISLPPLIPAIPGVTEPLVDAIPPLPILQVPTPPLDSPPFETKDTKPKKIGYIWTGAGDNHHKDFLAAVSLDDVSSQVAFCNFRALTESAGNVWRFYSHCRCAN